MTDEIEEEVKGTKKRKWMKLLFLKIPIFFMIFCAVMIGALKLVERHPEPLRQGFEEYLSKATQRNATIGTLEDVKFFPNFVIHAKNITVHSRQNAADIDLKIEEIKINAPFSTAFFSSNKMNELLIKNMTASPNMFGPMPVTVDSAEIITRNDEEKVGSFLIAQGTYNGKKTNLEALLEVDTYNYKIPDEMPFSIQVGAYDVNATLTRNFRSVVLDNTVLRKGEKQSDAKQYLLSNKQTFNTENPVSCLLLEEDLESCDKYLDVKEQKE